MDADNHKEQLTHLSIFGRLPCPTFALNVNKLHHVLFTGTIHPVHSNTINRWMNALDFKWQFNGQNE